MNLDMVFEPDFSPECTKCPLRCERRDDGRLQCEDPVKNIRIRVKRFYQTRTIDAGRAARFLSRVIVKADPITDAVRLISCFTGSKYCVDHGPCSKGYEIAFSCPDQDNWYGKLKG